MQSRFFILITSILLCVALSATAALATNYYVAGGGSDGNIGTLGSPFLTIQKAANVAMPGDNVYIRGGTYRETVTMSRSGASSSPINFRPYRSEQVTITGLDTVGGWTNSGGSTYQTSVSGGMNQVFVNGQMMAVARWPNNGKNNPLRAGYAVANSVSVVPPPATSTLDCTTLPSTSDNYWAGTKMAIIPGSEEYTASTTITGNANSGQTLKYNWPVEAHDSYYPKDGNRFFLHDSLAALNGPNQYYLDDSAGKLYLNTPSGVNPNTQTVEVRKRQLGIDFAGKSYVNVNGIQLKGASVNLSGSNNVVDNCQILYPQAFFNAEGFRLGPSAGVSLAGGTNNTLRHSEVAYAWGAGVGTGGQTAGTVGGSSNTIDNNLIHDVDWAGCAAAFINVNAAHDNVITNNTMYNSARDGVVLRSDGSYQTSSTNTQVLHNDISRVGFLCKDLGGIYTIQNDGGDSVIAYNRVHNNHDSTGGAGVYLDVASQGYTVHHNLVYTNPIGVVVREPGSNNGIYNNTLWRVTHAMTPWTGPPQCNTYNNLSNSNTWMGGDIQNNTTTTDSNTFVDVDSNDPNATPGDYRPRAGSSPVDAGLVIPGITDGYTGNAPDTGAFESGAAAWTAGAGWKTWLFPNQVSAPLTSAVTVSPSNVQTTAGSLIAGRTGALSSTRRRSFLKFDLMALTDAAIDKAVLRIYEYSLPDSASGDVTLHQVLTSWNDTSVSFSQSVGTGTSFYDSANLDLYTDIDVTSIVRGWLADPATNFGLCLRGSESLGYSAKYFDGLYGVTAPQLVITIPEPSSFCLMAVAGLAVVAWCGWRRSGGWRTQGWASFILACCGQRRSCNRGFNGA